MSPVTRVPVLRGRDAEENVLLRLLDDARTGSGGALLLTGAAGMGRTALLDLAAARAQGFRVLRVAGVESESRLPYAGLHGLLRPVSSAVAALPAAQARALTEALESGTCGAGLALPAAVLGLLAAVAAERPVLACVDDADRLDAASLDLLSFTARRLASEPIAMLFTARRPTARESRGLVGVPEWGVRGLEGAAVRELAGDLAPGGLAEDLLAALDQIACGNPLALSELIGALTPDQRAGLAAPPAALPPGGRLWRGHTGVLARLPARTRWLLLLIAADPALDVATLARAASPACALSALEPAERAGILRAGGDAFAFREAAMRAVTYHAASLAERRRAHRLLAGLLTPPTDAPHGPSVDGSHTYGRLATVPGAGGSDAGADGSVATHTPGAGGSGAGGWGRLRWAWHRGWGVDADGEEVGDELARAALAVRGIARPPEPHLTTEHTTGRPEPDLPLEHAAMHPEPYPVMEHAAKHAEPYPGVESGGGFPEPYLALERAAELTAHPQVKAERLAAAARQAWVSGRPQAARSLLARLRSLAAPEELRGHVQLLHGSLELLGGETGSAREELLAAARRLLESHRVLGVRALVRAADASYRAGDNRAFIAIARQAAALRRPDEPAPAQLMFEYLAGMAHTFSGLHQEAAGPLRRVMELAESVRDPAVLAWACVAGMLLGEEAVAHRLSARAVEEARLRGAASAVPQLLEFTIYPDVWMGRYASVAAPAAKGLRLAQETGQLNTAAQHLAWLAISAAVEGDQETCKIRADAAIELADAHELGLAGAVGNWALACLDLAAGRVADAAGRLRAERRNDHVVIRVMSTPHYIEAAARTGDRERAASALRVLERWVGSTRSPDLRALVSRCRALLSVRPGEAEELFRDALRLHSQGVCAFEAARTHLLLGSALRRDRRPGAARNHLHTALETFERHGARLWTEQARAELRASGEPVRPAADATVSQLTAQQAQIARMVAEGATNKEVAEHLFLSRRTVEHHLRNIFSKLGIRSRVELVRFMS
ncbi:LuxR C-terminal-related transcriptional regulator [Nonomuraea sp. NPDC052265]|uniref:helix-turn-helix transcriptional regulator n=1 Tax=Nonomuraea sp. NPDC052265 TaxID=3364374 RepID=UPI0037C82405